MQNLKNYLISFLIGVAITSIFICIVALKIAKPVINTDSFIESLNQQVKKLKQSGENNTQDIKPNIDITTPETPQPRKKFLGIFNRRKA